MKGVLQNLKYQGRITDPKDLVTKEYVDNKLAPVETSPTTAAYSTGDLLIYNGVLYKATADIAVGATLAVGTNIAATDVDEQVGLLKSAINEKTSIDLGISGASVGQIIKVLTVDGNGKPQTWQSANLPSNEVSVITNANTTLTLQPCPVTYKWGEVAALTLTVTATSQYHFMFTCPSASATVLTLSGHTGTSGDTIEAGKTYEVDVWAGVALIRAVEITAVSA